MFVLDGDPWALGWEAVAAIATALAAVIALSVWLTDRRQAQTEAASRVTVSSFDTMDADIGEASETEWADVKKRLERLGLKPGSARVVDVSDLDDETHLRVVAELHEAFPGAMVSFDDQGHLSVHRNQRQTITLEVNNSSQSTAFDLVVVGDDEGGGLYCPALHPSTKVVREGASTEMGWAFDTRNLVAEFRMGKHDWISRHGQPPVRRRRWRRAWRWIGRRPAQRAHTGGTIVSFETTEGNRQRWRLFGNSGGAASSKATRKP